MSTLFTEALNQVPKDIEIFVNKSFDLADYIHDVLQQQGKDQKDLADALGKTESEISKWLRGNHNFTLKTIAKIESVLGKEIINIPQPSQTIKSAKIISLYKNEFFEKAGKNIEGNAAAVQFHQTTVVHQQEFAIYG